MKYYRYHQKEIYTLHSCLLLRGGIVKNVPCIATTFWCIVLPTWVPVIPDSSTRALWQIPAQTPSSESGETWREIAMILPTKYLFHTPQGFLPCRKISQHGADGFTSPPNMSCYGFLSPLIIHRLRPGLNSQILGPIASTITIRPPRPTTLHKI
jgi:hypothetical protein